MEKDPVCGMDLGPEEAVGISEFMGGNYFFCSATCKQRFDQNPYEYVGPAIESPGLR